LPHHFFIQLHGKTSLDVMLNVDEVSDGGLCSRCISGSNVKGMSVLLTRLVFIESIYEI